MKALPCLLLSVSLLTAAQADWPTYQHDNSRVGHTDEPLKAPLTPRWEYVSPAPPQMAWAGEDGRVIEGLELRNRVRFDDAFQVAIADGRVYFGSTVDGRLTCQDLATGKELWSHFTDGPVRLAPAIHNGKIYFGSDDGHARCLDAKTGAVIWDLRAGPNDERILARNRMISRWPVRTGILVDDGIAYFGAGVFPHENIYLYAVEAATGKVVWVNDTLSQEDAGRNDLSPQGYLLATKDLLFVPSGRALSVAFDRKTGQQVNKPTPGWRSDAGGQIGGSQAMLVDDQILAVGEHQILALDQKTGKTGYAWFHGRQITMTGNTGFMSTGKAVIAIDREAHAQGTRERHEHEMAVYKISRDLRGHPALADLKKVDKLTADLKAAEKAGKQSTVDKLKAELAAAATKYEPKRLDYTTKKDKLAEHKQALAEMKDSGVLWTYPTTLESSLIHAGGTVIAGGLNEVVCLDADTGKVLWQTAVEGDARGLAVSDGHLVVSTTSGHIYTFADATLTGLPALAKTPAIETSPFPKDELTALYEQAAESILKETGIQEGFCLVLGSGEGRLAYELAKRSRLSIFGVEADKTKVRNARETLLRTGLYGSRIVIDHLDLSMVPYSSYFANLIVSDELLLTGHMPGLPVEVARTLKPIGGVLCLGVPDAASDEVKQAAAKSIPEWLTATKLAEEKATQKTSGTWSLLTRAALPGADSWSHQYGNAANTSSNNDQRVKDGLSILWYGDPGPGEAVNRHDGAVGPLSVNGRLFIQGHESIKAHDAFNGQFLWEVKNPGAMRTGVFKAREPGNMAASDDHLYMLVADRCLQFDAATGKLVHEFTIPNAGSQPDLEWGYIAYHEGLLYGTSTLRIANAAEQARRGKDVSISTDTLFAFDVKTGDLAWKHTGKHIAHTTVAIGDGHVFFIDASLTPAQREEMLRQDKTELAKLSGKERELAEERIKEADLRMAVSLDAKTGAQLWAQPVDVTDCSEIGIGGGGLTLMYHNGHIVLGGANANGHYWEQFLAGEFARRRIVVLDAVKGGKVWAKDANYRHRPVVIGNEVVAEPWSYDLYTGDQKMRKHPLTGEESPWMFARPGHHCGGISATASMMFFRSKSTAYYNMEEDEGTGHFAGQRLGCWINTIPANGLVMIPEASAGCVCLFSIAATVVFEPRDDRMRWGVYSASGSSTPVQHMALNLGAPGDRRDAHGKLWLGYPRPSSRAGIDLPLNLKPDFLKDGSFFALNEDKVQTAGADTSWLHASGARGLESLTLPLIGKDQPAHTYTVRLHFSAPEGDQPSQRVFDVSLQGKTVLKGFDIAAKSGGPNRAVVEVLENISVTDNLLLELKPTTEQPPILHAIEILRTDAEEIKAGVAGRL